MAFTFADNMRLGLQIIGKPPTGTSETPIGFKRAVVDDNGVAGEVIYLGLGGSSSVKQGLISGYYVDTDGAVLANTNGYPAGVYITTGNGDYMQTCGIVYVQADAALTEGAKVYLIAASGKASSTATSNIEIIGAIAGDPLNKISVDIDGTPTDLYPVYINNGVLGATGASGG